MKQSKNSSAQRFSLLRIAAAVPTEPKVTDMKAPVQAPSPISSTPAAASHVELMPDPMPASAPATTETVAEDLPPQKPVRTTRPLATSEDRHPKKKRSYSVDMGVCDDLELVAWYKARSSSSIVEELMRRYVSNHREELSKAREVRRQR